VAGIAVAVAVVFGLLLVVRVSQGAPPSATWSELGNDSRGSALALAGPGDHLGQTYTVQAGDSYWSIALGLAPNVDPRSTVDRLIEVNGGASSLQVGQRITIPADLLDG
jgi:Tfp pilus assembly protein FimV